MDNNEILRQGFKRGDGPVHRHGMSAQLKVVYAVLLIIMLGITLKVLFPTPEPKMTRPIEPEPGRCEWSTLVVFNSSETFCGYK